jgi:hypothetical protein
MDGKPRRGSTLALIAASLAGEVAIVAGAIALALAASHPPAPQQALRGTAGPVVRTASPVVPMEYAALTPAPDDPSQADITIHVTRTGGVLATVRPPAPYTTFTMISATQYAETYLVLAQRPASGARDRGQERLLLLKYNMVPGHAYLLPIPTVPAMAGLTIWSAAFSPDLRRLAVEVQPSVDVHQIRVYHTSFGPLIVGGFPTPPEPPQGVRTWTVTDHNAIAFGPTPLSPQAMSWAADDRMLAFTWRGPAGPRGPLMLDTGATGGSLLADSRLIPPVPPAPSRDSVNCRANTAEC